MIYFIQSGNFVKIGHSAGDPRHRLGRLQIGNPEKLTLIAVIEGGRNEEAVWHDRFCDLRVRGEWFKWEGALRDAVTPNIIEKPRYDRKQAILDLVAMPPGEIERRYDALFEPNQMMSAI